MLRTEGEVLCWPPKSQILTVGLQNCNKSALKHSIEKVMLLNFVSLSFVGVPFAETAFVRKVLWFL